MIGHFLEWFVARFLARLFPARYRVVPRAQDGAPMLRQFKLAKWAHLQSFQLPEIDDRFHIHRWEKMVSFVLSGTFVEERYPGRLYITHKAPSIYAMNYTTIHRFHAALPRTWTLFLMFGENKSIEWGYFDRPDWDALNYRAWNEEIPWSRRVKSL